MEFAEICAKAAELFPLATRFAIDHPGETNPSFDALNRLCDGNYARLGYRCHADCFDAIAPRLTGCLSFDAWCEADMVISGWSLHVTFRPFYLGGGYAHFELRHKGPLPGVTQTGYKSIFQPLATFANQTPEEFLTASIPKAPREQQLNLF